MVNCGEERTKCYGRSCLMSKYRSKFEEQVCGKLTQQKIKFKYEPIKIKYVHQGGNNPLRLILHGSYVDKLSKDYLRYLSNFIRKKVDLLGLTIIFDLKNQEK